MITLTVTAFNGAPVAQRLSATFDELGGTIGRADNNQLVLPDPERTISRVHAQVVWRSGRFVVVDRGSNPIEVNGRVLAAGGEAPLAAGDEVLIGGYALRVDSAGAAPAPAPPVDDPFAMFSAPPAPSAPAARGAAFARNDPFASALSPYSPPAASASPAPIAGIPEDWDPFGPVSVAKPPGPSARASVFDADPFDAFGLAPAEKALPLIEPNVGAAPAENSIDLMFGLGEASAGDPFANSALSAPLSQPNTSTDADPMLAFARPAQAIPAPERDVGSDLNAVFVAPRHASIPIDPTIAVPRAPGRPPADAVLSWGSERVDRERTIIAPVARAVRAPVIVSPPVAPPPAPAALWDDVPVTTVMPSRASRSMPLDAPVMPAPPPTATPAPPRAAAPVAGQDALLAALLDGLRLPNLLVDRLTPEFMRLVGVLLREATAGTVDLVVARAALKREIRAELTMIAARENNPLKFSPSAEVALTHLLNPPTPGFMSGASAMRDVYDDLRAHQFGMLAGMRAALEGVLKRFDPAVLETRLGQKSMLSNLLPASRKARLWELFNELYGQLSAEADDDFHALFGRAFLQAYEAHVDELRKDEP